MAWIESHQSLGTHRKLMKLMRSLHISDVRAVGHLQYLWWWALDNAPAGDLSGLTAADIAAAGHWNRDARAFFAALIDAGWIDAGDGGLSLHDWEEYGGRLARQRTLTREQRQLGGQKRMETLTTQGRHELAKRGSDARWHASTHQVVMPATVPNSTQPNSTKKVTKEAGRIVGEGVTMTEAQLKELVTRFGDEGARHRIEKLSLYKLSTGKKYKSDYHTVLNWERMDPGGGHGHRLDGNNIGNPRPLVPRAQYTRPESLHRHPPGNGARGSPGTASPDAPGEQP
jgi:hypothetical protein